MSLLAVPNASEGRDRATIDAIATAFEDGGARVLDVHADRDHHRSVFTLAGEPGRLAEAVLAGARAAIERIDVHRHDGIHPRVGALDVAPIVYLTPADRGAACAEALKLGDLLGNELHVPVFVYGALAAGRTRAELRRGGPDGLAERIDAGGVRPDFGPIQLHPRAGAVLVGARAPLVAFNVELAQGASLQQAQGIAARIRESGPEGLTGVRAIGLWLESAGIAQVSTNVEDHRATPLATLVNAIARHAEPAATELVGLAPRAAFDGFPARLEVRNKRLIEDVLVGSA